MTPPTPPSLPTALPQPLPAPATATQLEALAADLRAAGLQPLRPLPSPELQWAPGLFPADDPDAIWTALGLASRRLRS